MEWRTIERDGLPEVGSCVACLYHSGAIVVNKVAWIKAYTRSELDALEKKRGYGIDKEKKYRFLCDEGDEGAYIGIVKWNLTDGAARDVIDKIAYYTVLDDVPNIVLRGREERLLKKIRDLEEEIARLKARK